MKTLDKRSSIDDKFKWDLSSMISDTNEFNKIKEEIEELTKKMESYKGKITSSSNNLVEFLKLDEELDRKVSLIYTWTHMLCDSDTTDVESQKLKMQAEKINDQISDRLSFVSSEILSNDYDLILKYIDENSKLEKYRFYFEEMFRYKDHTLSKEEEQIITKALNAFGTGDDVFYNLDNADIKLGLIQDEDGNEVELTNSNYNKFMSSKNRNVRINAFNHLYEFFKNHKNTIAAALKGNIKENFFLSDVKKYNSPLEMSLYSDNIDKKVYENLIEVTHKNLDKMYEYMNIRKKMLGFDELHMYDIYVDLVDNVNDNIEFEEGKKIVFEALKPLGEEYLKDLEKAFSEKWIDIYPNIGKKSGAYSWGCYDSKPYLLLNYNNTVDSVTTMIHELGHSMHSYYSDKKQNYIYHQYPIFLAEIASTVNEVLLNDYLYKHAKNKEEKKLYLTEFLDKIRTTIYRQTMFAEFEMIMHDKEKNNIPLTEQEFSETYYNLNKLYYGNNIVSDDYIRYEWARIPHFYSSFYVYKYATGLSSALYIASDILNGIEGAKEKYLKFLSSGGSDYPLNILKSVGVDSLKKEPIEKAFKMFEDKLNELKELQS